MSQKSLSIILCSKNDNYCGKSIKKLELIFKYIRRFSKLLNSKILFDVILVDWGSSLPLSKSPILNKADFNFVKFLHFSKDYCDPLNGDSEYSQPHALNEAINHSSSNFFLKIDHDTIIGPSFFHWFDQKLNLPNLAFSCSRNIDYNQLESIDKILLSDNFQDFNLTETQHCFNKKSNEKFFPFFGCQRGVLFFSKNAAHINNGFNQDLVFQNYQSIDFINRLLHKYNIYNLGLKLNFDFYHVEHQHKDGLHRISNSFLYKNNIFPPQNKNRKLKNKLYYI